MSARLASLYRHPVKGFTPERVPEAQLRAGQHFPHDRLFAVEDGPSGFDPAAPGHVSKWRFAVLAKLGELARVRTRYDEAAGVFHVESAGVRPLAADLGCDAGRQALADWLQAYLGEAASGPLRVVAHGAGHRFMDHPQGYVSLINLESVRDLEQRLGAPVDPRRFRANLYVEGLEPWSELDLLGATLRIGEATLSGTRPIVRCMATHVHPETGERDLDVAGALHAHYGHVFCGLYLRVKADGAVREGDPVSVR